MKRRNSTIVVIFMAIMALFLSGRLLAGKENTAKAFGNAIADAVEKTMPSVVVVRTESHQYQIARDRMYGYLYSVPERLAGQGSGVIISKEGYILTNNHVVDDADKVEVVLNDGTKLPADVVGYDVHTDLAVLKIVATNRAFTPVEIGDSDALRVGEFVIALGSPFSLSSSVTLGIVSQKGRSIGLLPFEDFIQTDAAVNKGNSGGPLVDVEGNLVGINTVIQTAGYSQGNIGISFSVPANLAMRVAESIIQNGRWYRPWIGILMHETESGIRVSEVVAGGPADQGGLKVGDVIRAIDRKTVRSSSSVQRLIFLRNIGDQALVEVMRGDSILELKLTTEPMPAPQWILQN